MEWCLNCHRHPERHLRPKEAVFLMDWVPPRDQPSLGRELVQKYHIEAEQLDELLGLPSMKPLLDPDRQPMSIHESDRSTSRPARRQGPPLWRSLEELAGDDSFQELLDREFPSLAVQWLDEPSRRRFLRLMGASLALSGIAGCGINPPDSIVPYVEQPEVVVPGKPLLLRHGRPLQRRGHRRAGREPHRPAHQDRGQSRAPGQPGGHRRLHPGGHPVALRPRPLAGRDEPGARQHLGTIPQPGRGDSPAGPQVARAGPAPPDRFDDVAHVARPDPAAAQDVPRGEVAQLRAGGRRGRPRGDAPRVRRGAGADLPLRPGRRHPLSRGGFPRHGPGGAAPRPRLRVAAREHVGPGRGASRRRIASTPWNAPRRSPGPWPIIASPCRRGTSRCSHGRSRMP